MTHGLLRRAMLVTALLVALPLTLRGEPPAADPRAALRGIDELIDKALVDQKIPGASVGVVVGDDLILLKGYGRRDVAGDKPMTPDTMIQIASITKQFTVASLGTLVRRGKLEWDKPVRDVLPEFRLNDDYATLHATPRDLVTHRIGLPRHDMVWFGSTLPREELYRRLRYLPFSRDIRTEFQYNNFMFMTAGYLAGRINGTDYETLVQSAIFDPLGMKRSTFSMKQMMADADRAMGYQLDNQRNIVPHELTSAEAMAPTGAILSTARDLTAYMRMMLAGGSFDGKPVLQPADVAAMMQPQTPIGPSPFPEIGFRSYGMGFFVENYRGHEIAHHGGNLSGAAAMIMFVPKSKIGVIVLTNRTGARLRDGLPREIIDRLLGLPSANMIERNAEMERKALTGEEAAKSAGVSDRKTGTTPSHALVDYAGRFSHPAYDDVEIAHADGKLSLRFHDFSAPLEHWHYDLFKTPSDKTLELDDVRVQFITDMQGELSSLAIAFEPSVDPIRFARTPPPQMLERAFLERFVGVYDVGGVELSVRLREDGVLQTVQLGTVRDLVPVRGTLFRVKQVTGLSMEFLAAPDGTIDRLAIYSGGSTIAPRKK